MSSIPAGAAYRGATIEALERAKKEQGESYLPSVFNPATVVSKGPLRIGQDRIDSKHSPDGKPGFDLYYELHGKGPKKLAFLMGLNNSCFGWLDQVEYFGSDPEYSVLVLDNRGYGNTDAPKTRYKTTDFALDVLEVLQHIGWTQERSVNLIGVSMGGMIALELARMEPRRFCTLLLLSTTAGDKHNLPPIKGISAIGLSIFEQIIGYGTPEDRINRVVDVLFPQEWLKAQSEIDPTRTNVEVIRPLFMWRFGFSRRAKLHGAFSQIAAALTHHVPSEALAKINVDIPKIRILTGDWDQLVNTSHSKFMSEHMPNADYLVWPGGGHALHAQFPGRFNAMLREWAQ
ncbi:hypothetical protein MPSI1_002639 [Malassezia psittaci]|uniref:AB hydrolase-1 domain-containing protein n=1 Tax=Malassezia psittaci TaxID=1821823 RepID=A0AAF0FBN4_9BASI|nr:hypothetical protein MPSI1_002639 [Malassezia psittaci]